MLTGGNSSYRLQVMSWKEIPFRSVVRQKFDFSCGSAAVATLLSHHYERATPEEAVFAAMWNAGDQDVIRKSGFSMLDIKRYLESAGYRAEGFRLSIAQLQRLARPGLVILDLKGYKHFVVVKGIQDDAVLVGDPMIGLTRYSHADFISQWNGIFLSISDDPGALSPRFNVAAEWRPWSTAPLDEGELRSTVSSVTNLLPPVYQVTSGFATTAGAGR